MYVCMYVCMYVYMYVCMYVCMYVFIMGGGSGSPWGVWIPVGSRPGFGTLELQARRVRKQDFLPQVWWQTSFPQHERKNLLEHMFLHSINTKIESIFGQTLVLTAMAAQKQQRGPKRNPRRKTQIRCAYKRCRRCKDVKNIGKSLQLERAQCELKECRNMRAHCKVLRFCSTEHLEACRYVKPKTRGAGHGSEAMDVEQFLPLCKTVFLLLFQLYTF